MIMTEQIHITEFKPVTIVASHCFYGLFVASHLGLVEYIHILKEQAIQEVSESADFEHG